MKSITILLIVIAVGVAEPPRYRFAKIRSQRQEVAPATDSDKNEAPYPPSGWRPSGPTFILPARQLTQDQTEVAPSNTYGPPDTLYGAPINTESSIETTTNAVEEDAKNVGAENLAVADLDQEQQNFNQAEVENKAGAYYLLFPDSTLQRVDYMTENDIRNMAYTARLQYRNEQPAPIYLYSSDQYIQLA